MKQCKGCEHMIFCIKKLYISISNYFLLMLIWIVLTGKIKTFLICLTALILHELGHIIAIYLLKEKINIFYILPFGFCCRLKNQNKIKKEKILKILLAGPATSLCLAGLFIFWTKDFGIANFIIGVFNLLPLGELDGGRLLKFIG